jgi:signal transduction histidine kinase
MFRITESKVASRFSWAMSALVAAILVAALFTAWLTWMLYLEQGMNAELAVATGPARTELVVKLANALGWQVGLALVVLTILLTTAGAVVVMLRAYLTSLRRLREVKVLAGDILSSMDQAVVTTDREGLITSMNPRGRELLSPGRDCVGQPLAAIQTAGSGLDALRRSVLETCRPVSDRPFSVTCDGHVRRLRSDCHVLHGAEGDVRGTVLHIRDVTERALIDERIRRMERHGELGAVAAGLHHEIKNPLTALSLHVQLLDERLAEDADSPAVNEMLGVIKTEITRLNGVLDTFRSFASLRALSVQPADVLQLVHKSVRLLQPQAQRQGVRLAVRAPESGLPPAPLDAPKFEQMLLNLMINGLEAMPKGGDLTISVRADSTELQIDVADTGSGIPPDIQPRIFDPYFTTRSDGAGMGLAWSERIVQMHQGHIDFQTGPRGTTFSVTIPLTSEPDA